MRGWRLRLGGMPFAPRGCGARESRNVKRKCKVETQIAGPLEPLPSVYDAQTSPVPPDTRSPERCPAGRAYSCKSPRHLRESWSRPRCARTRRHAVHDHPWSRSARDCVPRATW
eukprot:4906257-Prymnesium_polylepis.2